MSGNAANKALNEESQTTMIITIISIGSVLTTILVALRTITRGWIVRSFGADDWVILASQACILGAAAAAIIETHMGMGRHVWTVPPGNFKHMMQAYYATLISYYLGIVLIKISILLMYRRVFVGTWTQRIILGALIFVIASGMASIISLGFYCTPIEGTWDLTLRKRCIDYRTFFVSSALINTIVDFAIFFMPLFIIKQLQLPLKQKIALLLIFCVAFFATAISIYRLCVLFMESKTAIGDGTWHNAGPAVWTFVELCVLIAAACLPTLRPFFIQVCPKLVSRSSSSSLWPSQHTSLRTWGASTSDGRRPPGLHSQVDYDIEKPSPIQELPPVQKAPDGSATVGAYRETVVKRGSNKTVIAAGGSIVQSGRQMAGIWTTKVVKQEYE